MLSSIYRLKKLYYIQNETPCRSWEAAAGGEHRGSLYCTQDREESVTRLTLSPVSLGPVSQSTNLVSRLGIHEVGTRWPQGFACMSLLETPHHLCPPETRSCSGTPWRNSYRPRILPDLIVRATVGMAAYGKACFFLFI